MDLRARPSRARTRSLPRGPAARTSGQAVHGVRDKATIADDRHGELTWGAAQAGVAQGVAEAVAQGSVARDLVDRLLLIAAVWVNPEAREADLVFANNSRATAEALAAGAARLPQLEAVLEARSDPFNPYFPSRGR